MIYKQVNEDLKFAMKNGNTEERDYIKVVKAELQRISKTPTDEECLKVFKALKKSATENNLQSEINYLDGYLPTLMSEDEIITEVDKIIKSGVVNFGKIMGTFNTVFRGKADNKLVSNIVKNKLRTEQKK